METSLAVRRSPSQNPAQSPQLPPAVSAEAQGTSRGREPLPPRGTQDFPHRNGRARCPHGAGRARSRLLPHAARALPCLRARTAAPAVSAGRPAPPGSRRAHWLCPEGNERCAGHSAPSPSSASAPRVLRPPLAALPRWSLWPEHGHRRPVNPWERHRSFVVGPRVPRSPGTFQHKVLRLFCAWRSGCESEVKAGSGLRAGGRTPLPLCSDLRRPAAAVVPGGTGTHPPLGKASETGPRERGRRPRRSVFPREAGAHFAPKLPRFPSRSYATRRGQREPQRGDRRRRGAPRTAVGRPLAPPLPCVRR